MRFCQSFMGELAHHIGPDTDVPEGGIGVGAREIGYLFGMYRKQRNEFAGVLTGKGLGWGGSFVRPEAAGYGLVYFAAEMLASRNETLDGKHCLVSGSGNVAQHCAEKIIELGGKVLTLSDSSGYVLDEDGIDREKLAWVKRLKNLKRGRIREYVEKYPDAVYTDADASQDYNPLWSQRAECAFPCATENEIREKDAYNLINNGIKVVCEGADMPCTSEAVRIFVDKRILYAPAKAANAGGVAVSGLEMAQNRMLLNWSADEVDQRLRTVMKSIHRTCLDAAADYGQPGNLLAGANIEMFTYTRAGRERIRHELGLENKFIAIYAGIHGLAQGLETLFDAACLLQPYQDIHILLVGDGPKKSELLSLASKYNLPNLTMLPEKPREEMPDYLSAADVSLIPLIKAEIFKGALPSKIFDAWACERPVLISINGEARQIVESVGGGTYIPPEDADKMAEALILLWETPSEREIMGQRGLVYTRQHHSRAALAEKLILHLAEYI